MANNGSFISRFRRELRYLRALLRDPRTPKPAKWLIRSAVAYLFSPIDLIPDFLPVVGQLDDLIIVSSLIWLAMSMLPDEVKHDARMRTRRIRDMNKSAPGPVLFETSPLPGPIGIRVDNVDSKAAGRDIIFSALTKLVFQQQMVIMDQQIFHDFIKPYEGCHNRPITRQLKSPSLSSALDILAIYCEIHGVADYTDHSWVNMVAAFQALPSETQKLVNKLQLAIPLSSVVDGETLLPLVIGHPVTGIRSLSPAIQHAYIQDMPAEASRKLLERLNSHIQDPQYQIVPATRPQDVLAWDSLSMLPGSAHAGSPHHPLGLSYRLFPHVEPQLATAMSSEYKT